VRWFGGDAVALSTVILEDAGDVAAQTQLLAGFYYAPESPKKEKVVNYVKNKLGEGPDIYSLIAYDCAWVVPYVANNYFGASGWTELDETGDRTGLDIIFYQVKQVDSDYEWVVVAKYFAATGSVEWLT